MSIQRASDLVEDVEFRISVGRLVPGDRLPPVRALAGSLGLAPNTVAAAYRRLRDRGVVVGRGRQGTVVADRPVVAAILGNSVPVGMVDAMTGNPDTSLLPDLGEAFSRAVAVAPTRYGDQLVDPGLAARGRALFAVDGIDPSHFTVVSGAMDAVERILAAHLRTGDRVGVEDPGYASVHQLVSGLGFESVPVEVDEEGAVPEALAAALDRDLAAVVLTPRAHNPTGAALTKDRAAALAALLAAHPNTLVVEDDHAGPVAGVDHVGLGVGPAGGHQRWAVVRSVAKSLGPDMRVAMVAGDKDTIDRVEGRLQLGPGWVSHVLQRAVAFLLSDPAAQAQVAQARLTYRRRRERLLTTLEEHRVTARGRSGLHVWVPVPDEQSVVTGMRDAGFAIRGGNMYRVRTSPAVRITTAALQGDESDALAAAMHKLLTPGASPSRLA